MQIRQFTRIRNMSMAVTIICAFIIFASFFMDTNREDVGALRSYMAYSRLTVLGGESDIPTSESSSTLMREDARYKADPNHEARIQFDTVDSMQSFVDEWEAANMYQVSPYVNAYIKQSLWEYADWCISEDSPDYWHMKYIASQKTGGYSYARQIKYRWLKFKFDNSPFIVTLAFITFVFVNVVCALYGLSGSMQKTQLNKKMPKWYNDYTGGKE